MTLNKCFLVLSVEPGWEVVTVFMSIFIIAVIITLYIVSLIAVGKRVRTTRYIARFRAVIEAFRLSCSRSFRQPKHRSYRGRLNLSRVCSRLPVVVGVSVFKRVLIGLFGAVCSSKKIIAATA